MTLLLHVKVFAGGGSFQDVCGELIGMGQNRPVQKTPLSLIFCWERFGCGTIFHQQIWNRHNLVARYLYSQFIESKLIQTNKTRNAGRRNVLVRKTAKKPHFATLCLTDGSSQSAPAYRQAGFLSKYYCSVNTRDKRFGATYIEP